MNYNVIKSQVDHEIAEREHILFATQDSAAALKIGYVVNVAFVVAVLALT